ncbi:MAG: TrgA family protein [Rhodobacteraceae bacterium]|jgi:deoxyhypusine synthase|nr:TrgA family protein [Paracoccaceae bacterium]
MPTAAKLVAALSFAFAAWVVCIVLEGFLPEAQRIGRLYSVSIAIGALGGWFVSGAAPRASMVEAAATGLRTATIITISALLAFAVGTMLEVAMRGLYGGPMEAFLDIFNEFADFGSMILNAPTLAAIILGGIVAGMVTESAGRRWR